MCMYGVGVKIHFLEYKSIQDLMLFFIPVCDSTDRKGKFEKLKYVIKLHITGFYCHHATPIFRCFAHWSLALLHNLSYSHIDIVEF